MHAPTHHLNLPFFTPAHQTLAEDLAIWAAQQTVDESDDRRACKEWVRLLGDAGWLRYCVPAGFGGAMERLDSRALVILRETLAFHSPLADFAFAMQAWAAGPSPWRARQRSRPHTCQPWRGATRSPRLRSASQKPAQTRALFKQ